MNTIRCIAMMATLFFLAVECAHAQFVVLHHFTGLDGSTPYGTPVIKDGFAYGTTFEGNLGEGVVWRAALDGSSYNVIHVFTGLEAGNPITGLVINGTSLYGVAISGGPTNAGVVFKLSLDLSKYTVLHKFNGTDGSNPMGKLAVVTVSGVKFLYGTTQTGGADGLGTIFRIKPDGTSFSVIHEFSFDGTDSREPLGGIIELNGKLFGTTRGGGTSGLGTVYRIKPDGTGFTQFIASQEQVAVVHFFARSKPMVLFFMALPSSAVPSILALFSRQISLEPASPYFTHSRVATVAGIHGTDSFSSTGSCSAPYPAEAQPPKEGSSS